MKILVFMKNWIGDTLFQIPALEAIKARYPRSHIACIAPPRCHEILRNHPAVSRVISFDEKNERRSFFKRIGFVFQLRKEHWDRGFLFHGSRTRAFLFWAAGVKERIGYARDRRFFLTQAFPEPASDLHQVDYFLELLVQSGIPRPSHAVYHFYPSKHDQNRAETLLENYDLTAYACFHIGANWEPKRWPAGHFSRLADLIFQKWRLPVVITGSSKEEKLADQVLKGAKVARIIPLTGKTSLSELGALFEKASFVVSGDSGPMHMASAVGAPVVALFGPTDPALTGPRGSGKKIVLSYVPPGYRRPWYGSEWPKDGWLSNIQPEDVIRAVEKENWIAVTHYRAKGLGMNGIQNSSSASADTPQKILIVTLNNIGDAVLSTPVITTLAQKFPEAERTVVVGPRAAELLQGSRYIDRLVVYNKKGNLWEQWKFLQALRRNSYDWVVDLRNTAIPYLVDTKKRSPLFRRFHKISMRQRHLEVLEKMGVSLEPFPPPFDFFQESDEAGLLDQLKARGIFEDRDWIVIAPGSRSPLKTWRVEGFREVLHWILTATQEKILLVGDEAERPIAASLAQTPSSRIYNFAGETNLKELAVLVSRASLVLSNDSAVMHLAYELDRPTVAVFGPTHPKKYGRVGAHFRIVREEVSCSPCEQAACRFDRQACFEDLHPEKVIAACRELLQVHSRAEK